MDAGLEVSCPVPAEHVLDAMTPGDIDPDQGEDLQ